MLLTGSITAQMGFVRIRLCRWNAGAVSTGCPKRNYLSATDSVRTSVAGTVGPVPLIQSSDAHALYLFWRGAPSRQCPLTSFTRLGSLIGKVQRLVTRLSYAKIEFRLTKASPVRAISHVPGFLDSIS